MKKKLTILTLLAIIGLSSGFAQFQNIYNIYSIESVYLGILGGYNDNGANSSEYAAHFSWAKVRSNYDILEELVKKYCFQFDRQALFGKEAANNFYAVASVRFASYGYDFGDSGANSTEKSRHLSWTYNKTIPEMRAELEKKLRFIMYAVSN